MKLRIDLHVHTAYSRDGYTSVEEAFRRCRAVGLDGFALTDHDTIEGVKMAEGVRGGPLLIPGVEVTAVGGHILALNISELIPPRLSLSETVERIREQGGVAVLAHPSSPLKTFLGEKRIAEAGFTALEVANSMSFPYNWSFRRNLKIAERLRLPKTGGSDAHVPEVIGRAYTVIDADSRDMEDVVRAIERGYIEPVGEGIAPFERFKQLTRRIFSPAGESTH